MSQFMMHCNGREVTREELSNIQIPEEVQTETYQPVPHSELAEKIMEISTGLLSAGNDFSLYDEKYGIARDGNQLFGLVQFQSPNNREMGLSIAFRNSLDKSMSVGFAAGANVFVCDNLALSGDIKVMKKHTKNVWHELQSDIVNSCYKARHNFSVLSEESDRFRQIDIEQDEGFKMLGLLYGKDILTPKQLPKAKTKWVKPDYDDFKPRNVWSLYNAVTEGLKSSHPQAVMEKHTKAHKFFQEYYLAEEDAGEIIETEPV